MANSLLEFNIVLLRFSTFARISGTSAAAALLFGFYNFISLVNDRLVGMCSCRLRV